MKVSKIIQESFAKILFTLSEKGKCTISDVSEFSECAYAHTFNTLKMLEKDGFVESEKIGRMRYVWLTDKGIDLSERLKNVILVVKGEEKTLVDKNLQRILSSVTDIKKVVSKGKISKRRGLKYKRALGAYKKQVEKIKREKKGKNKEIELVEKEIKTVLNMI